MKIELITTFNEYLYNKYAKTFLDTYNWPYRLNVLCEDGFSVDNYDIEWVKMTKKHKEFLKRNSGIRPYDYKEDAVRFCHKVFAYTEMGINSDLDYLIFLDADMIFLKSLSEDKLLELFFPDSECLFSFYARKSINSWAESGAIFFNLKKEGCKDYLREIREIYSSDRIYELNAQADGYVTTYLTEKYEKMGYKFFDLSSFIPGESDPMRICPRAKSYWQHNKGLGKFSPINSPLGNVDDTVYYPYDGDNWGFDAVEKRGFWKNREKEHPERLKEWNRLKEIRRKGLSDAKKVFYGTIPCNSIGDTICKFDEHIRIRHMIEKYYNGDVEYIALVHTLREDQYVERIIENKNPSATWSINFNFLDIQKKAKWFNRYYFIEGIHEKNYKESWAKDIISTGLSSFYYNEPVDVIPYQESPFWTKTSWIKDDVDFIHEHQRKMFSFLEGGDDEYSTLHYTSLHYKNRDKLTDRRISKDYLIKWLSETACSEIRMIGTHHDVYANNRMLDVIAPLFPDKNFVNLCGEQNLEESLSTIYNGKSQCNTESFSGYFSASLGIPTDHCWRFGNPEVYEKFLEKWGKFPNMNMFLDVELGKNVV